MVQEFGVPVQSDGLRNFMRANNFFEKQIFHMYIKNLFESNKVNHFEILINHHKYRIKSMLGS